MKALTYHGSEDVRVETVPDPRLEMPDDVILRVTATAICGSDLHMYRGKVPGLKDGDILGHEFMGIVEETGASVKRLRRGDRVVVPFTISCGSCFFCEKELYASCERTNPGPGGQVNKKGVKPGAALFGFTHLYGGVSGGQAELVRVPFANVGPLRIESSLEDARVLFLSDILPTGYQAALDAGIVQGSTVAILGAGPVGLMAAASARLLGAETIYMIDHHPYRLEFARTAYGVIPLNFDGEGDAVEAVVEATSGLGVDATIDAVGFEARGGLVESVLTTTKVETSSGASLRAAIALTRRGGTVSVPGVYLGFIHGFPFGDAFDKGLRFVMGQTNVQKHMPVLLEHIEKGRLRPEAIITHELPLEEAARGYKVFDEKKEDCRKVILRPGQGASNSA